MRRSSNGWDARRDRDTDDHADQRSQHDRICHLAGLSGVGEQFVECKRAGYADAEAQRQLAAYLFAHTRVERLEASTDVDNPAEQRALERAGFTREGMLRSAQFRDGGFHDLVIYSRLRCDRPSQA